MHLKLVSKLALITGFAAAILLILIVVFVGEGGEGDYAQIIQAYFVTRQQLGPAILITALVLLVVVGITTWLITLYSSFRVAGPLYRFGRNFIMATQNLPLDDIRRDDPLHDLSYQLQNAVETLHLHYRQLDEWIQEAAVGSAESESEAARSRYREAVSRLKNLEAQVRIDE